MLLKLSEKLKVMRTDRPDEWTMDELLRDAVKLEKERDDALAKLAAMEKQEPVQWVCELASNPWPNGGGTRRGTKEEALNYINSESNHCKYDTVSPIYRLPVQADNPAVAVPDGWREIVEAVAHIGVDFGYGNFVLSHEHIEKARLLLAAAPSHSQQSADDIGHLDDEEIAARIDWSKAPKGATHYDPTTPKNPWMKYSNHKYYQQFYTGIEGKIWMHVPINSIDDVEHRFIKKPKPVDRCPSHESEQYAHPSTGDVKPIDGQI